jgi:hypothetical protein
LDRGDFNDGICGRIGPAINIFNSTTTSDRHVALLYDLPSIDEIWSTTLAVSIQIGGSGPCPGIAEWSFAGK